MPLISWAWRMIASRRAAFRVSSLSVTWASSLSGPQVSTTNVSLRHPRRRVAQRRERASARCGLVACAKYAWRQSRWRLPQWQGPPRQARFECCPVGTGWCCTKSCAPSRRLFPAGGSCISFDPASSVRAPAFVAVWQVVTSQPGVVAPICNPVSTASDQIRDAGVPGEVSGDAGGLRDRDRRVPIKRRGSGALQGGGPRPVPGLQRLDARVVADGRQRREPGWPAV